MPDAALERYRAGRVRRADGRRRRSAARISTRRRTHPELQRRSAQLEVSRHSAPRRSAYFRIDVPTIGSVERGRGSEHRGRGEHRRRATEPRRLVPAAGLTADRRGGPGRGRLGTPPLLRRGDGCGASLGQRPALAALCTHAARSDSSPRPVARAARFRAHRPGAQLAALSRPSDHDVARVAAHLLRDDRPLRERRPLERPRRPDGHARATGYDPADAGWFHGGDLEGLTGAAAIRPDGLPPRQGPRLHRRSGSRPSVGQRTVQGDSAAYHGYWGIDFTDRRPAPRHRRRLRRVGRVRAHGSA